MAQKDYVSRGRSSGAQRKKNAPKRKKVKSNPGTSKILIGIAGAVLVIFIGALWFIAHHKQAQQSAAPLPHKSVNNGLPPKPEERWKYIKELENRQITTTTPIEPSAGGEVKSPTQLTNEQKQLLAQMAADMQQQPTPLNEVPWNQQGPEQQQTLRKQYNYQPASPAITQAPSPYYSEKTQQNSQAQPLREQLAAQRLQQQKLLQHQRSQQQLPQHEQERRFAQQPRQVTRDEISQSTPQSSLNNDSVTATKSAETSAGKHWQIQCGSFKGADQAESTRAALAFEGFESRITVGGGWNRVVIGPYSQRSRVDTIVKHLRSNGHTNCITLTLGG